MSFVRNPDSWNADRFDFDRVTTVVYQDNVAALNALKSGKIDVAGTDSSLAPEAEASGFAISKMSNIGNVRTLFINDRLGETVPALGDVRVRRAMNMAFDQAAIAESLYGGYGVVSSQPFPAGHLHYVEGGDDRYPYDLKAARDLLAEAGYEGGFELQIATSAEAAAGQPIVEQSLADIGIRVTWDVRTDLLTILTGEHDYSVVLIDMLMLGAVDWLENFWGFSTAESTELDRVFREAAPSESQAAAAELGEYILDNAWYVPIAHPDALYVSVPTINVDMHSYVVNLEQFMRR
jgi:peptide/nickel transport system substrate-binding protein